MEIKVEKLGRSEKYLKSDILCVRLNDQLLVVRSYSSELLFSVLIPRTLCTLFSLRIAVAAFV